jgi:hypothetical protein
LSYYDIKLDCRFTRLQLPSGLPKDPYWSTDIVIPWINLNQPLNTKAQKNVERKDQIWNSQDSPLSDSSFNTLQYAPAIPKRKKSLFVITYSSWQLNQKLAEQRMYNALFLQFNIKALVRIQTIAKPNSPRPILKQRQKIVKDLELDLCLVSADAFVAGLKRSKNHRHSYAEYYSIFIHALDRIIDRLLQTKDKETKKLILAKLLLKYIYILILRRLTPSVHLLANSKGNHITGKKPLAAA